MDAGGPEILRRLRILRRAPGPRRTRTAGRRAAAALCAAALCAAAPAASADRPYAGRPLAEALLSLAGEGVPVVFTSELVRPEMVVEHEPSSGPPEAVLRELLAPHGLAVRPGPGGVLVVVADPAAGAASLTGRVLGPGGAGVAGAVVRLVGAGRQVPAAADGSFTIAPLAPGAYALEAAAPGHLDSPAAVVELAAGAVREVVFTLQPLPFVEDEIVVRPSRLALLGEEPVSSFSLSEEEIESLPHLGGDLFRAATLLPGVAGNDVSAQFHVRGGRRDEVRVLLDGQELYDAFHLPDYDKALSIVPAHGLAGADLATGGFPVSHGDRMGGVLDLRTVDPAERRIALGASVLAATASGMGTFAGGRGAWLGVGRRGSIDLANRAIGDEDPQFWDVLGKVELDTALGSWSGHLLHAADELELLKTPSADERERLENDYRSTYGWLTHRAAPGVRLLVETMASRAEIRRDRVSEGVEEDGGHELHDRRELAVFALTQSWDLQLAPRHLLRWGGELRRYEAELDYAKRLEPEIVILAPFAPPRETVHGFRGQVDGDHGALWVSDRVSPLPRLTAELGLRWDRHGRRAVRGAVGDEVASPRVNLAWRLGERSVARAAWGRFAQSQRPYEVFVEDGDVSLGPPEEADHWVVGVETLPRRNRWGVEAVRLELYRRDIDAPRPRYENLLEPLNFFPEIEPDRVRIDPAESRAEGVELFVRARRGSRLDGWLTYAYASTEDRVDGRWVPRASDQPHTVTADLAYRAGPRWTLNLAWRYHTGWPTTPVLVTEIDLPDEPGDEPPEPGEPGDDAAAGLRPPGAAADDGPELALVFGALRSERLPVYHRLDLRVSRRWPVRHGELTVYADVQNLYDRENAGGIDVQLDEDTGLVARETESWPGIVPSVGFAWTF